MKLKPVFEDVKEFSCQDLYLNSIGAPSGNKIWKTLFVITKIKCLNCNKVFYHLPSHKENKASQA
jgi:hypothetical protein